MKKNDTKSKVAKVSTNNECSYFYAVNKSILIFFYIIRTCRKLTGKCHIIKFNKYDLTRRDNYISHISYIQFTNKYKFYTKLS